jgi:hypothetical protein
MSTGPEVKRALLVGIDQYDTYGDLWGCVNDAEALQPLLACNDDDTLNFKVKVVVGTVTRERLLDGIRALLAGGADFAPRYFAGHAYPVNGDVALATFDGRGGEVLELVNHSEAVKEVLHYEKLIRERTLVMKFDTVRHGYAENIAQWREADVPKRWSRRFRKRRVTASLYVMLVACALRDVERELRGKPFAVRYPTRRVPTN